MPCSAAHVFKEKKEKDFKNSIVLRLFSGPGSKYSDHKDESDTGLAFQKLTASQGSQV